MINWLTTSELTKRRAYTEIAEKTGMSAFAVEKDWWVIQAMSTIFEMEASKHLVFKGGTSLSKAWKLIDRFSEDVDLAIDREFLGFSGELSKDKRMELRKKASLYTSGQFFNELREKFAAKGFEKVEFKMVQAKDSDQDPRIIEIYYPYVIAHTDYMQPKVQIEIGCRSLMEPHTVRTFGSLVDEIYSDQKFALPFIKVPTVNPERTFLEKIFLLHEEFHRTPEKMRLKRLSRHLYDVVKLAKTEFAEKALTDQALYSTIVEHRFKYTHVGGVDYNLHQPQTINPIPIPSVIAAWKADYNNMVEDMIYEQSPPSFEQIIKELNELKQRINNLDWKFEMKFPLPK